MNTTKPTPARSLFRTTLVGLLIIGLAIVPYAWFARRETDRIVRVYDARAAWAKALDAEDLHLAGQITQSLRPVDEYFDQVAIPHIGDFLADYSGLFYDTPRFAYKWLADKTGLRGNSNRVQTQVKASLAEHLGFPDQFQAGVRGSIERFHALQQQQDAELREKAYTVLHGAGVDVDKQALDSLLKQAHQAADRTAFETLAHDSAAQFGGAMAGKEIAVLALQTLVVERAMVAIGARMGIVAAGAGAAGATAGAGTATGVGALPGWGLAAAEIGVTLVVDMAASYWMEAKAEAQMHEQLSGVRTEIDAQLRRYMMESAKELRRERRKLVDQFVIQ